MKSGFGTPKKQVQGAAVTIIITRTIIMAVGVSLQATRFVYLISRIKIGTSLNKLIDYLVLAIFASCNQGWALEALFSLAPQKWVYYCFENRKVVPNTPQHPLHRGWARLWRCTRTVHPHRPCHRTIPRLSQRCFPCSFCSPWLTALQRIIYPFNTFVMELSRGE